jgi:hypothetical protein
MTGPGPGPLDPEGVDAEGLVVLVTSEADLLLHVLAAFERLLRLGELTPDQQRQLLPPGAGAGDGSADVEMAEIVVEAGHALRRQR